MAKLALVNFDQLIKRLRFNLKSAKSAVEVDEYKRSEDLEALENYIHNLEDNIEKLEIAKEIAQKDTLTEEDVKRVMRITCYGDIGYCCGLSKQCVWRESCRKALRIDDETYID